MSVRASLCFMYYINAREYRRGNQKRITQRNWQQKVHMTKKTKKKKKNILDTLYANKHEQRKYDMCPPINTNNVNMTCVLLQTRTT